MSSAGSGRPLDPRAPDRARPSLARLVGLMLAVVGALVLVAPTQQASASARQHVFFVDCGANQGGDGSLLHPWDALLQVEEHGEFLPGDRISLRRGTICHGQLKPAGNGSSGHPIVVGAYGRGSRPTIAGGGTASWNGAVELVDQHDWTIQDLHVTNTAGGRSAVQYRSGVLVLNEGDSLLGGILIQRLAVDSVTSNMSHDAAGPRSFGGISVLTVGGVKGGFDHPIVRQNVVAHVGRSGIIVSNNSYPAGSDRGTRISANTVRQVRGDGIVLLGSRGGRMDHNVSANAAQEWPCAECGEISRLTANAAIWTGYSDRVRIDHNEAYGTKALGGDGEGFDIDSYSTRTIVEYNYSHDNEGGGIFFCGSTDAIARFNILEDNAKSAFAFIGTARARNTEISNNTVFISSRVRARPVRYFNGAFKTRIVFRNNLVFNASLADWAWPSPPTTAANTVVGRAGHGRPTDRRTSRRDPRLRAVGKGGIGFSTLRGYTPTHPHAVPAGVPISGAVTHDFFGKKIDAKRPPRGAAG